ncbi:toprim domain-containing protein [Candidatus Poribacteria bacterium]|nr:toprim domain-containing protein [Candidatus Poribacteria bacterium]
MADDLIGVLAADGVMLRPKGKELVGGCPFCRAGDDRFLVDAGKGLWWCRKCRYGGNVVGYLQQRHGIDAAEARRRLGMSSNPTRPIRPATPDPPREEWQDAARRFVDAAAAKLWDGDDPRPLDYLRGRRFTDDTIRQARLGLNPTERREKRPPWMAPGGDIWIPRGIVIPVEVDGALWAAQIRRAAGEPKYVTVTGSRLAPHGIDGVEPGKPAMLVEGVFDMLAVRQAAGDLVVPVATLGASSCLRPLWTARLLHTRTILLAFDADEAGETAAARWRCVLPHVLPHARRWRPFRAKDTGDMLREGGDVLVRRWAEVGIESALSACPRESLGVRADTGGGASDSE